MTRVAAVVASAALSLLALGSIVLASDPPDSRLNPQSGFIETTDSFWSGTNYNVRHTIVRGQGQFPIVTTVSVSSLDDFGPRLAIAPAGDTWVVWWRDAASDEVLIRKRSYGDGTWGAERLLSDGAENARHPSVAFDGSHAWVGYEHATPSGRGIGVVRVTDDPAPIPTLGIATTVYSGDLDVQILSESGHLWVTWIDGSTNVGWCEYGYGTATWSSPSYESYASDSVVAARGRIRASVTGN